MGRRRRSLLGSKASGHAPTPLAEGGEEEVEPDMEPDPEPDPWSGAPEADDDADTVDAVAPEVSEEPEPPAPEPEPEPPEPEPEPVAEEPSYVSYEDPPTGPDPEPPPEEPSYVSYGTPEVEPPQDAPFAKGLFGDAGYDEFESVAPPTEEVPAGVMEDVSQPYNSPYSVPEPPPIPGILDRFTPPPAQRTDLGSRGKRKDRPDYLDDTPAPSPDRLTPVEPGRKKDPGPAPREVEERESQGPPMGLIVVGGGLVVGVLCVGAIIVALIMSMGGGAASPDSPDGVETPAEREQTPGGVEVRNNMTQKPGLIGVDDPDGGEVDGVEGELGDPEGTPDGAEVPAPAPSEPEPPKPVAPPPRPVPKAEPTPPPAPVAVKATLKIRSNRRVLVYVNGQAIGYTPQDYKVDPGTFSVSAMVPGQPATKQTRDASVSETGSTVAVDFTF